jgi:hypothetical protein
VGRPLVEKLTPTVRTLVIIVTLGYLFFVFTPPLNAWMMAHLFLGPGLFHGEILAARHRTVPEHAFHGLDLHGHRPLVGGRLHRARPRPALLHSAASRGGVAANLAAAAVSLIPGVGLGIRSDGAAFALTAVFVAFARIYGARPAQIWGALSMRADYFTWILIGFSADRVAGERGLGGNRRRADRHRDRLVATGRVG